MQCSQINRVGAITLGRTGSCICEKIVIPQYGLISNTYIVKPKKIGTLIIVQVSMIKNKHHISFRFLSIADLLVMVGQVV